MKDFYDIFGEKPINKLCELCDDYIWSMHYLGDLYENVPENLKSVAVSVLEIHLFPEDKKAEVLAWLNK